MRGNASLWRRWELPTWAVAVAIYGSWFALVAGWAAVPAWMAIPAMAWLLAWHGSLQHETIHGHPTRSAWVNAALGSPPLALWLPYELYRSSHISHHRDEHLTVPEVDPESYYVPAGRWTGASGLERAVLVFHHTLLGRVTIGPAVCLFCFFRGELRRLVRGEHLGIWAGHVVLTAAVVGWLAWWAVPAWAYGVAVYLSISLTQVRSFAEHKASAEASGRTAVVEAAWPMALLFLYNNLHARHHARPDLPWFELSAFHRSQPAWNGLAYRGYADILGRVLLRPVDRPVRFMDLG